MVAIVDDDELMRGAIEDLMKAVGLRARAFASAEEFLESGQEQGVGCLISDVRMPGMSGLELQVALRAAERRIRTIFISAYADERTRREALRGGALDFVAKPFDDDALIARVRTALAS